MHVGYSIGPAAHVEQRAGDLGNAGGATDDDQRGARLCPGVLRVGQIELPGRAGAFAIPEVALQGNCVRRFMLGLSRCLAERGQQGEEHRVKQEQPLWPLP